MGNVYIRVGSDNIQKVKVSITSVYGNHTLYDRMVAANIWHKVGTFKNVSRGYDLVMVRTRAQDNSFSQGVYLLYADKDKRIDITFRGIRRNDIC